MYLGNNLKVSSYIESLGFNKPNPNTSYFDLIKRQPVKYEVLTELNPDLPKLEENLAEKLEIGIKYEGYIKLQLKEAEKLKTYEKISIPDNLDYLNMDGVSLEAREKLNIIKPKTIGEAQRITNVHPADINALILHIKAKN